MAQSRYLFPYLDHHQLSLILDVLGTPVMDDFNSIKSRRVMSNCTISKRTKCTYKELGQRLHSQSVLEEKDPIFCAFSERKSFG
jgi:mitogen-activated protein kinase 1/3